MGFDLSPPARTALPPPRIVDSSEIAGVGSEVGTSRADREFDRFLAAAIPTESGGLRDPVNCSEGLARQIREGGISWEVVEESEIDYASLGRGAKP